MKRLRNIQQKTKNNEANFEKIKKTKAGIFSFFILRFFIDSLQNTAYNFDKISVVNNIGFMFFFLI